MPKNCLKKMYFLDDQELSFSDSLQSLYYALIPNYQFPHKFQLTPLRMTRSFSYEQFPQSILCEFQGYLNYLQSMFRIGIIKWSFAIYSTIRKGSLNSPVIFLILVNFNYFRRIINCLRRS